jgi:hypothetical protein
MEELLSELQRFKTLSRSERVAQIIIMVRSRSEVQEVCQSHYRNDPVKYDLAKVTKSF